MVPAKGMENPGINSEGTVFMDDFFALGKLIGSMVAQERPARILELSGSGSQYGHLLKACQEQCGIPNGVVDRIVMPGATAPSGGGVYRNVFGGEVLDDCRAVEPYDFAFMIDLPVQTEPETIRAILDRLQGKITRQILILVPLDSEAGVRKFHPVLFLGLDFAFCLVPGTGKEMQAYSVFRKMAYGTMPMDHIPTLETIEKLRVAFVLPFHGLTGGIKALLQQIRHLTRKGHTVSVYFRSDSAVSAIPPWSDLTEDDYARQIVIPASGSFNDFIQEDDVILLGSIHQAGEFISSKTPVVLWEQGFEAIFGDFGKALHSFSYERLGYHVLYRLPIHLLAVSPVIAAALRGIYNREAFIYPSGIDTEFYHPAEKHNETPVVLLVGHPSLAFKGFQFAFDLLQRAHAEGLRFQVKWAAQVDVLHGEINFPLEVIVHPTQHELAELYRQADILLSTSLYESYALPPLEAMASGTAVIATDCGGIRSYAKPDENCILCRQGDLNAMTDALARLLNVPGERQRLAKAGRETALAHCAEAVIELLERRLTSIVRYSEKCRFQGTCPWK